MFCNLGAAPLFSEANPLINDPFALDLLLARGTTGMSQKTLRHFLQSARTRRVAYYDYGAEENMERYGTELPPLIPFEDTQAPVAILAGSLDLLADVQDAEWYADQIGDALISFEVYNMGHFTFTGGYNLDYMEDVVEIYESVS